MLGVLTIAATAILNPALMNSSVAADSVVTTATCTTASDYNVTLTGTFPTAVTDVAINYVNIARSSWTQTATTIVVRLPLSQVEPYNIIAYFGSGYEYMINTVNCATGTTTPAPVTPPTENGGVLPNTASNNYNSLLLGSTLGLLGGLGLFARRRIQA